MTEFIKEYNEELHQIKVYCEKGHYITSFVEGDDILTFSATKLLFCPDTVDVDNVYHCITDYMYNKYSKLKAEAVEEADVEALYEAYPEQPDKFMEALIQMFGEGSDKVVYYFEKYYPVPEEITEETVEEE